MSAKLLTVAEVCARADLGETAARSLMRVAGGFRLGGVWRIEADDLEAHLAKLKAKQKGAAWQGGRKGRRSGSTSRSSGGGSRRTGGPTSATPTATGSSGAPDVRNSSGEGRAAGARQLEWTKTAADRMAAVQP